MLSESRLGVGSSKPVFDPRNGDLLVLDSDGGTSTVDRYGSGGGYLGSFPVDSAVIELAVRPQDGAIYAATYGAAGGDVVSVYTAGGAFVRSQPLTRFDNGGLSVRPDGTRLWTLVYNSGISSFETGEDGQPDPAPAVVPETTIDSGPSGTTDDVTPTFAFSSNQPASVFECRIDATAFAACTSPFTAPALADGPHAFEVRARTDAGPDPTPASRAFSVASATVDPGGQNPQIATTSPIPGQSLPVDPVPVDRTGPTVPVPSVNRTVTASRSGVVTLTIGPVTENTTGTVLLKTESKVAVASAAARRRVVTFGTKSLVALKGRTVRVRISLSRRNRTLLRKLKRVKTQASITLRDAKGNATVRIYRFTLKAPRR